MNRYQSTSDAKTGGGDQRYRLRIHTLKVGKLRVAAGPTAALGASLVGECQHPSTECALLRSAPKVVKPLVADRSYMNTRILLSVAALMLGSVVASAEDTAGPGGRPKIDTNGDGSIDLPELQAVRPNTTIEQFNAADADRNGLLSRDEMRAAARAKRGPPIDTNNDGAISFEELQSQRPNVTPEQFAALDADKSGALSREEVRSGMGRKIFQRLDADSSGGVSFGELATRMPQLTQERFDKLDKDSNGQLSQGELASARPHHGPRPAGANGTRQRPAAGASGGRVPRGPRPGG